MSKGNVNQNQLPQQGKLYLVETENAVWWSKRKLDAAYKHVEFRRGQARYREVDASRYRIPENVRVISLDQGIIEEAV